jgi:hypothetical protein
MTFHVYIYTTGTGMSIRGLLRVPGKIPEARPILLLDTHTHCAENARRCEASLTVRSLALPDPRPARPIPQSPPLRRQRVSEGTRLLDGTPPHFFREEGCNEVF